MQAPKQPTGVQKQQAPAKATKHIVPSTMASKPPHPPAPITPVSFQSSPPIQVLTPININTAATLPAQYPVSMHPSKRMVPVMGPDGNVISMRPITKDEYMEAERQRRKESGMKKSSFSIEDVSVDV